MLRRIFFTLLFASAAAAASAQPLKVEYGAVAGKIGRAHV